uniref:Phospholipase D delta-like n=1 Tax=Tanacetum cinerariifolium TaxID=118510 RepID=A0A6L2K5P5_TANCI|nr:phospholipase D delta-like [Tanacetum cinerariifolium]
MYHWHEDALLKIDRISWILTPSSYQVPNDDSNGVSNDVPNEVPSDDPALFVSKEDNPENWHVQSGTSAPRQPWHDLHCKIDGPAAYDVLTNFEQRWRKATRWSEIGRRFKRMYHWHEDALLKIDRISWILTPSSYQVPNDDSNGVSNDVPNEVPIDDPALFVSKEDNPENWHVQDGVMQTHDEDTRKFFKHSSVHCVLCPRYASTKLSIIKQQVVGTLYTHHQKCVIVDTQAEGNHRKISAFIGGDCRMTAVGLPKQRRFYEGEDGRMIMAKNVNVIAREDTNITF